MENKEYIEESSLIRGDFMNPPVDYKWTKEDIVNEYQKTEDVKSVSKTYCISVKEVSSILKDCKLF